MRPSAFNRPRARRTVVRDTLCLAANSSSVGRRSPEGGSFARIAARSRSASCSYRGFVLCGFRTIDDPPLARLVVRCGRAAGLPRIRLRDLRHTYASTGLANATGWHEVKIISQRLGHASVGFTIDTYTHVLPAADAETAYTLARQILGEAV